MASQPAVHRRPFHGSCHCGNVKYIYYITLPDESTTGLDYDAFTKLTGHYIYKCNCTPCHNFGFFHIRPADSPADFMLLSPSEPTPENGISNYKCNENILNWYFCSKCGSRCYLTRGPWEHAEVEFPVGLLKAAGMEVEGGEEELKKVKVYKPKKEGWDEKSPGPEGKRTAYLSVNATTLHPLQEGLDLRVIKEKGWVLYLDWLSVDPSSGKVVRKNYSTERPCVGGMY